MTGLRMWKGGEKIASINVDAGETTYELMDWSDDV